MHGSRYIVFLLGLMFFAGNASAERWTVLDAQQEPNAEVEYSVDESAIERSGDIVEFNYRILTREADRVPEEDVDEFRVRVDCRRANYEIIDAAKALPPGHALNRTYPLDEYVSNVVAEQICG